MSRRTGCPFKKIRYKRPMQAFAAAVRVSRHIGPTRVYRCPGCGDYHLTTQTKRGKP